ncbi:hypothetical protein NC652_010437 [Populus alba x Populus x berolinensis]|nr:hypothetical protein NC652_010437 [Populus alba x Populus x berolinensis]
MPQIAAAETTPVIAEAITPPVALSVNASPVPPAQPHISSSMMVDIVATPSLPSTPPPMKLQPDVASTQPPPPTPPPLPPFVLQPATFTVASVPPPPPPTMSRTVTAPQLPPPPPPPPPMASGTAAAAPRCHPHPTNVIKNWNSSTNAAATTTTSNINCKKHTTSSPTTHDVFKRNDAIAAAATYASRKMELLHHLLHLGKVEGGNQLTKSPIGRKGPASSSAGGKQGMADALAEITKRSAYFQQIEEDVQKYSKVITELKAAISTFKTKDMTELIKFHKHVESILEKLTDETQKLEALRTAAALGSKLNGVVSELKNWKVEPPLGQLLDKTESYFNKIKGDLDALERTKDEESKKFQSHNIDFDFHILVQIKESMVDVSSSCMELALKERRQTKAAETAVSGTKTEPRSAGAKMLWRAFQFAFRVYSFAGGHDDRADMLTRELAHEIETDPHHQ